MCRQLGYVFVYVGFLGILCGLPDWLLWKCRHCNFLLPRPRRCITICMSEGCGSARFAFRNGPFCAAILPVSSANMVHSVTLRGRSVPGKRLPVKSFRGLWLLLPVACAVWWLPVCCRWWHALPWLPVAFIQCSRCLRRHIRSEIRPSCSRIVFVSLLFPSTLYICFPPANVALLCCSCIF